MISIGCCPSFLLGMEADIEITADTKPDDDHQLDDKYNLDAYAPSASQTHTHSHLT